MTGQRVLGGRYQLIDQLGSGGMAVVWRAQDLLLGRTVAVKLLAGKHVGDPESRQRIWDEARAAAALSHPNIAQVYDFGESEEAGAPAPYVVMELVRGGTLQQRLAAGAVPPRFALRVGAEVAAALAAAHAEGLVHRDVKPANVMVAPDGVKVVDFGIAAAITPSRSGAPEVQVFGTPAYLAPERLVDDAVEPASDVYALGVLVYRLLTGHSPWSVDTTTQMLTAHVYIEPTPLTPLPEVPDYAVELCNRCLSKDPTMRPSAREAAALLARASGLRVVEDVPVAAPTGPAIDERPSVVIRPEEAPLLVPMSGRSGNAAALSPATPNPATPNPATLSPATPNPATLSPATPNPATPNPATPNPATPNPATPNPATPNPATPNPATAAGPAAPSSASEPPPALSPQAQPPQAQPPAQPPPAAAPARAPSPAHSKPTGRGPRVWLVTGATVLLVAVAVLVWVFWPEARDGLRPGGTRAADAAPALTPSSPAVLSGPVAGGAGSTGRPGTPSASGPSGRPAATRTATAPGGGDPPASSTPVSPRPTTTAVPPSEESTFSTSGGTVTATCTAPTTARLVSWTATKPFKVSLVDPGPKASAAVIFRHGNRQVLVQITCRDGIPAMQSLES